jgi:hypothetical protein
MPSPVQSLNLVSCIQYSESRGDRTSPLQIEVVTDKILQEAGVSTIFVCIYDMEPEQYVLTSVHHPKTQNSW